MMTPFIIGANRKPDLPDYLRDITPEQAEENARVQQRQRAFERNIRKEKERLAVAKELKDVKRMQQSQHKINSMESSMAKLIKGNEFLVRKQERERYYNNPESYNKAKRNMEKAIEKEYNRFNERLKQKLSKEQYRDLTSHDLKRIRKIMAENEELGERLKLKVIKQKQHIYGTEDYKERVERDLKKGKPLPSYFRNVSETDIYKYMLKEINMKSVFNDYQYIDVGGFDGDVLIPNERTEKADRIKVHQGKQGIHGIPNKKR